jgi:hypothetical protein
MTLARVLGELVDDPDGVTAGPLRTVSAIVVDAMLSADLEGLAEAQRGLQRLYALQVGIDQPTNDQVETRGQIRGMLELIQWGSRRSVPALPPPAEGSHARRLLETLVHRPGITSQELADLLSVDKTEISRTGGRLVDAGLARRRKAGRNAHWEITPRGRHSLRTPGPIDEQYYGAS